MSGVASWPVEHFCTAFSGLGTMKCRGSRPASYGGARRGPAPALGLPPKGTNGRRPLTPGLGDRSRCKLGRIGGVDEFKGLLKASVRFHWKKKSKNLRAPNRFRLLEGEECVERGRRPSRVGLRCYTTWGGDPERGCSSLETVPSIPELWGVRISPVHLGIFPVTESY